MFTTGLCINRLCLNLTHNNDWFATLAAIYPLAKTQNSEPLPNIPTYLNGIQGLRTIAAILVAVYHIWFHRVSGGVDVFFVVAGYFATKTLIKIQYETTFKNRVRFVTGYWTRTIRRILPSAVVVIVGTVVAAFVLMPQSTWSFSITHGFAALFQYENWQLIASGADYLQTEMDPSPFQQFWALSLQSQIYLTLPVILLVAILLGRQLKATGIQTVVTVLALLLGASFIFSVWYVAVDQPAAYFNTFSRYWEFIAGSLLYILLTRGLSNKKLANALGWAGLLVLIGLGMLVDVSNQFPGWVALIPVGAAILIMVSAASESAPLLLRRGPLVWLGSASFAFYLWHWPILVIYRTASGHEPGLKGGMGILILSMLLAIGTTKLVETPFRNWRLIKGSTFGTLTAVLVLLIPAVFALNAWQSKLESNQENALISARSVASGDKAVGIGLVPDPSVAGQDYPDVYRNGCNQNQKEAVVIICESGVKDGSKTIAVVGGSHSAQWIDIVRESAGKLDAKVATMTKSACLFGDIRTLPYDRTESCAIWSEGVLNELLQNPPDLVVTTATRQIEERDEVLDGYYTYFEKLDSAGIPILGIRDNPRFAYDVAKCVEAEGPNACTQPSYEFYEDEPKYDFSELSHFTFLDIVDTICPAGTCEVVQDDVLVYRDAHHFTRTWVLSHGGPVDDAIMNLMQRK